MREYPMRNLAPEKGNVEPEDHTASEHGGIHNTGVLIFHLK